MPPAGTCAAVRGLLRGPRGQRQRHGVQDVDADRVRSDVLIVEDDELGEGAGLGDNLPGQRDRGVPDRPLGHVLTDRVDDTGGVPPEDQREPCPVDAPVGADFHVSGVDRRGVHAQPDLPWPRLGDRHFGQAQRRVRAEPVQHHRPGTAAAPAGGGHACRARAHSALSVTWCTEMMRSPSNRQKCAKAAATGLPVALAIPT